MATAQCPGSQPPNSPPPAIRAPIVMTMGEPSGIGVEIALKAWSRRVIYDLPPFYLIADPNLVREEAVVLGKARASTRGAAFKVIEIAAPAESIDHFEHGLPVLCQPLAAKPVPGVLDKANAAAVLGAIEAAVLHVRTGQAAAIVTNPIQKSVLHETGFEHPGHTEYLAALCGDGHLPVMLLSCPGLKTVPVTIHLALEDAIAALTTEMIVERALITAKALDQDFGFRPPRLAIAGLNPHAGEAGNMGREEAEIIQPAIDQLRARGISVIGPMAPDSMFHEAARKTYDVAICMYHDQALIPVKTLGFENGINVTLGLPIIRTSPDHGTALDIAGKGQANSLSLISAVAYAGRIARNRARAPQGPV